MHGSSGSRSVLVHLLAGAALGAVAVLIVWIFSGGRPFGEVVGTSDVSSPTTAAVKQTNVPPRAAAPAGTEARLESEPPALRAREAKGGGDAIQFRKPEAKRRAKAARGAAEKRRQRDKARTRKREVVRVVSPPAGEDTPVAAVPPPAPSATPSPAAPPAPPGGAAKPAKPRTPTYVAGAGEG